VISALLLLALKPDLQAQVDRLWRSTEVPGMVVGYAYADGRTGAAAAGFANLETKAPMEGDARILAGSVGKTFVAAYAMKLVEQGKLKVDELVSTYLGREDWYSRIPNNDTITIRDLMRHTSGIPEHVESADFVKAIFAKPDKRWSAEELLAFTLDKKPLFEAGKGWAYADTNYVLLGAAIEAATGKPLFSEIQRTVVNPLKLNLTAPSEGRRIKGLPTGYQMPGGPFGDAGPVLKNGQLPFNAQMEYGGGGMVSNAQDLAKWAVAVYSGKVLKASSLLAMIDAAVPARTGRGDKYGLGVMVRTGAQGTSYGHQGWYPGYLTEMEYFPSLGLAVAVQFNSDEMRKLKRPIRAFVAEIAQFLKLAAD